MILRFIEVQPIDSCKITVAVHHIQWVSKYDNGKCGLMVLNEAGEWNLDEDYQDFVKRLNHICYEEAINHNVNVRCHITQESDHVEQLE